MSEHATEQRLRELGIELPTPATPVANYIPFVRAGTLLFISGQLCLDTAGKLVAKGKLGKGISIEEGQQAARAIFDTQLAQRISIRRRSPRTQFSAKALRPVVTMTTYCLPPAM